MARHRLQLLLRDKTWQVYFQGTLVAKMHTDRMATRRDYLVYRLNGHWQRFLVEQIDATHLPTHKLVELFMAGLQSREIAVSDWQYYPRCRFRVTASAVELLSKERVVYQSKKPLSEFQFTSDTQGRSGTTSNTRLLSEQLRRDYRSHLILSGQPDDPHRRDAMEGRGYCFLNHSLYIRSLHLSQQQVIAKLYDRVPQYSHLHGVVVGRFMRRPFAYAVTFRDVPNRVLETRIRRTFEEHYGLSFSQKHLEIQYVPLRGEITADGHVLLRTPRQSVLAASQDGVHMTRRVMRDKLYIGGEYLGLHISHYPRVREMVADHMSALVDAERANLIVPIPADEPVIDLGVAYYDPVAEATEFAELTGEIRLSEATQDQVHDDGSTLATDHLVAGLTRRLSNKVLTLFPYLNQVRFFIPR